MSGNQVNLSGWRHENWTMVGGQPPVVLNPAASVHSCIAWGWGEAQELLDLLHAAYDANSSNAGLIEVGLSRATVLSKMLEHLAERTAGKAVAATPAGGEEDAP
ncbi:hypothetical protein [Ottowia oryzae]|uniref:DUF3077 domain-containing protein n=1 Tax=Ottowia oryzae TaxID=2109914 RepID=A0A2S0MHL1_9BURK|nr:hypothetical protein [Ottowia oryzae]AVO35372.1 hypothetical protein C6570_14915 [Ottowia oryzae]